MNSIQGDFHYADDFLMPSGFVSFINACATELQDRRLRLKDAVRELIRNITAVESKRIRQASPINIPVNDQGQPTCF